jgi:tetratricopeptide (TPR) repeat protein
MDDIFAIQDDIAQSVVGELRDRLVSGENDSGSRRMVAAEVAKAVKGRAADPEAQRLMLLGRYLLERQNEPDAIKAVEYFRQALELDPNYALAWAHLGQAYTYGSNNAWHSLDTNYERAEESFQKALEIDPGLAEGYAGLGRISLLKNCDFLGAEQHIERALVLSPENADVLLAAATVSQMLGEFEKALEYCRRVIAIDPLNPSAWSATSRTHFLLGRLSEAEAAANRTLEIVPQGEKIRVLLGLILLGQGRAEEALAQAQMEDSLWRPWALAIIHDAAGRRAESDKELEDLVARYGSDAAFQRAEVHGVRGEIDQAFDWLERAVAQHDPGLVMAKISPFLKSLHNDPRWKPMLKRIGFPD